MALSKAEKEAGYKMARQPSAHTAAILRRVAAGHITVTLGEREGKAATWYTYDDGREVRGIKGALLTPTAFATMVKEEWLIPIPGETLIEGGPPQRYRARRPGDGVLPRYYEPPNRSRHDGR